MYPRMQRLRRIPPALITTRFTQRLHSSAGSEPLSRVALPMKDGVPSIDSGGKARRGRLQRKERY